jgi:hypothetical protein
MSPPAKGNDGHGPHCKHFANTTEQIRHNRQLSTTQESMEIKAFSLRILWVE